MLRNFLAAALRNLERNRFYAVVSIACLSVGLAATFLAVAYIDHLRSYNRWIADYQQVFRISLSYTLPGVAPIELDTTPIDVSPWAAANVPGVVESTRIVNGRYVVRHGNVEAHESIAWADSNLFRVLPLPVYSGDLQQALAQPNSIVLTRTLARKYFGDEDALGQTLEINREHPMVVRAVLEDLPPNTRINRGEVIGMLAASSTAFSSMQNTSRGEWSTFSFVRVQPGVTVEQFNANLTGYRREGSSVKVQLRATPLDQLVYSRDRQTVMYATPMLAVLVLLISCMNFVNLTTARSIHRSTEVGVRKAAGAGRASLIGQFMGEALIFSAVGMVIALSLCELLLPVARTLLDVPMAFEYWRSPQLLAAIVTITVVTAVLSGFYPAVLLSRLNPASILNGGRSRSGQSRGLRQSLVVAQFALLASLVVSVIVAGQQVDHLLKKSQRFDGEHMLLIHSTCRRAFVDEVQKLAGVAGAACALGAPINIMTSNAAAKLADGTRRSFEIVRIDAGFLELYGFRPLAGRFFRAGQPADLSEGDSASVQRVVISATALREFGFESAEAALGRDPFPGSGQPFEIIGVVDDFRLGRFDEPMYPVVYIAEPSRARLLSVRLRGEQLPETLDQIDALWRQLGDPAPIERLFLSESLDSMHRSIVRQRQIFSAFAVLAVSLAIVGLLGLASSAAEERRLEIGVRKAFGAGTSAIVRLILWRFMKLAAVAGIVGGVLALPLMRRWLEGFEDRIDLEPWMFAAACTLIVAVALLTVLGHSVVMARARPIAALRVQ